MVFQFKTHSFLFFKPEHEEDQDLPHHHDGEGGESAFGSRVHLAAAIMGLLVVTTLIAIFCGVSSHVAAKHHSPREKRSQRRIEDAFACLR